MGLEEMAIEKEFLEANKICDDLKLKELIDYLFSTGWVVFKDDPELLAFKKNDYQVEIHIDMFNNNTIKCNWFISLNNDPLDPQVISKNITMATLEKLTIASDIAISTGRSILSVLRTIEDWKNDVKTNY